MKKKLISLITLVFLIIGVSAVYSIQAQTRLNRMSERQVNSLVVSLEAKTSAYKSIINRGGNRGGWNNSNRNNDIASYISNFETAMAQLKQSLNARNSTSSDVENLLNQAGFIDNYMKLNRSNPSTQSQWDSIKTDLNSMARFYNVNWNWETAGTTPNYPNSPNYPGNANLPYRANDNELRTLLGRIETQTDAFQREVTNSFGRGSFYGNRNRDSINTYVSDFETATNNLKNKFNSRTSINTDVQDVLNRAGYIDSYMRDYRLTPQAQSQWNLIKNDLNTLSNYYSVSWNWNETYYPNPNDRGGRGDMRLTGTYRLNVAQSDDVQTTVDNAMNTGYAANQRDRFRRNLERRLMSPDTLVIEKSNQQVTIASSNSPQMTLTADGIAKTEQNPNGRTVSTKAEAYRGGVTISYEGDRSNDFYVTFMPDANGQLRVTRRLYLENQNNTITVTSVYDKLNPTANWSAVNNGNYNGGYNQNNGSNGGYNQNNGNNNDFIIPNGTKLNAVLTSELSTKTNVDGDRFTMEVRSPSPYNGAIIEGHVSTTESSGRVSGRAQMTLVFDQIRLRNGRSYRFSGLIDSIRTASGDTININNEGAVRDNNQTTKTVTRAGIGAGIGALIGAIAGGGSGAAIGAAIGAGAGAGSVVLQGRDNLEIKSGTEFNLTSSAPSNMRASN